MLTGFFGIHELFGAHELFGVQRAFRSPPEHLRVFARQLTTRTEALLSLACSLHNPRNEENAGSHPEDFGLPTESFGIPPVRDDSHRVSPDTH